MNTIALRPRSIGEILDAGFQLYRRGWIRMSLATAVLVLPLVFMQAVGSRRMLFYLTLGITVFYLVASAAAVVIAAEEYEGRSPAAEEAIRAVIPRLPSVLGAAAIQWLLIYAGIMLYYLPAVILYAWTFAMQQAVMLEGYGPLRALERSWKLAQTRIWHVLAVCLVSFLLMFLARQAFFLLFGLRLGFREYLLALNALQVFLYPLAVCIATALYFDLRIRSEALDVEMMMADELDDGEREDPEPAPA